jgi:hypothetical protein
MSRLDELPPDQSAALSLLLRQRKSYAEVAKLLGIGERAVHDRAHAALVMLAPRRARELTPEHRLEVGDYVLGQQAGVAERLRTRAYLASDEPARAWAGELAAQLSPLAGSGLPEIPAATAPGGAGTGAVGAGAGAQEPQRVSDLASTTPASPPGAGEPGKGAQAPSTPGSSRTAGAVLLAVLAAAVIVAVVLITSGGSSSSHAKTTSTSATTTTAKGKGPKVQDQIKLKPTDPNSKLIAVVYVLAEGTKRAFFIAAQNLPATKGFYYAIWLYNSPSSVLPLSRSPQVGSTHSLAGGSALPANAGDFREILLTEETRAKPTHPGHVVARGPFKV